jgi:hypothetical protein
MSEASDDNNARATAVSILYGSSRWSAAVTRPAPHRGYEAFPAVTSPGLHNGSGHHYFSGWVCTVWGRLPQLAHSNNRRINKYGRRRIR